MPHNEHISEVAILMLHLSPDPEIIRIKQVILD